VRARGAAPEESTIAEELIQQAKVAVVETSCCSIYCCTEVRVYASIKEQVSRSSLVFALSALCSVNKLNFGAVFAVSSFVFLTFRARAKSQRCLVLFRSKMKEVLHAISATVAFRVGTLS